MKEKMKQRKKNARTYIVCLLVAITMWVGLKYNTYTEEQRQIKKICQIEKKAKESKKKEETKEENKTKKIAITKKEEKNVPDNILPDTTIEIRIDTLTTTTESQ